MTAGGQSHLTPRLHRGTIVERCESFTPLTHNVLSVLMARRAHSIDPIQVNRSAVQLKSFVKATEHGRRGSSAPYRLGISGFEFNRPLVGSLELNPDVWPGDSMLSQIYVLQGRPQDALPEIKLVRYDHQRAYLYAIAYYALGRKKESDDALRELIHKFPQNTYEIAGVYAFRNQSDEAFEWLDRAYVQRNAGLIETKVDPLLKSLHHDPRFASQLKKLNFPI